MQPWGSSLIVVHTLTVLVALAAAPVPPALEARQPLRKEVALAVKPSYESYLTVKFVDDLRARDHDGLTSASGRSLTDIEAVTRRHGLRYTQLVPLPADRLVRLEQVAAARSGVVQPDLAGLMRVDGPDSLLQQAAHDLLALPGVEWVQFVPLRTEPPCQDIPPTTQNHTTSQAYLQPNAGMNVVDLWSENARGAGIKTGVVEGCYLQSHEDLCGIAGDAGQSTSQCDATYLPHGTGALGILHAPDNGYGITGIVPAATMEMYSHFTGGGLAAAIDGVDEGDVVLVEMQTYLPGHLYGPLDLSLATWTLVRVATDAGRIVVLPAGNGAEDLDASHYAEYRARGDSGAIIVGAGRSLPSHHRMEGSTYGSRVNVQGWGENVFTTYALNGDPQSYTPSFSGTSSASALIAGAVTGVQSLALDRLGCRLEPQTMRTLLVNTGIAQEPGGPEGEIGPFPNLAAAADLLLSWSDCPVCGNGVREYGEDCDGSQLGGASCGSQNCDVGMPTCTARCTLDYTDCACCENLIIRPETDSGGFIDPRLAYDGELSTFSHGEFKTPNFPVVEHDFVFPDRGRRTGGLKAVASVSQGGAEPGIASVHYSLDGGASYTKFGSTGGAQTWFTVDLADVNLGQLRVRVRAAAVNPNAPTNLGYAQVYEAYFVEAPPPSCQCATDDQCPEPGDVCAASLCLEACPTVQKCGECQATGCNTNDTDEIACLSGVNVIQCPVGETIHTRQCTCTAVTSPAPLCLSQSRNWFCSP